MKAGTSNYANENEAAGTSNDANDNEETVFDGMVEEISLDILHHSQDNNTSKQFQISDGDDDSRHLIITEGRSANSAIMSYIDIIGRLKYSTFALSGVSLNVRDLSIEVIIKSNKIYNKLCKVVGLKYENTYDGQEQLKELNFSTIVLMTDQDYDGFHIKALLLNYFQYCWPNLLKIGFVKQVINPLFKAKRGTQKKIFYSIPHYEDCKNCAVDWSTYVVKFHKAISSFSSDEMNDIFNNFERNMISFAYTDSHADIFKMAFSVDTHSRFRWIEAYAENMRQRKHRGVREPCLSEGNPRCISIDDFFQIEYASFCYSTILRGMPSVIDGLKPAQRKIMYACLNSVQQFPMKVSALSTYTSQVTNYQHGHCKLFSQIIKLAQNYVGSNNINLLEPKGHFGLRYYGGKDDSAARYLDIDLSPLMGHIFHPQDDQLLQSGNIGVEPFYYIPIIPLILVNGFTSICFATVSHILKYNVRNVILNLRHLINREKLEEIHSWYRNYKGEIELLSDSTYISSGNIRILKENVIQITELPIGIWTQNYEDTVLKKLLNGNEFLNPIITHYENNSSKETVNFSVTFTPHDFKRLREKKHFHRVLKLNSCLTTFNMNCIDHEGFLKNYRSPNDMLQEFYNVRMPFYVKRRDYLLSQMTAEVKQLTQQIRFIDSKDIYDSDLDMNSIIAILEILGYPPDPVKEWQRSVRNEVEPADKSEYYKYLLEMPLISLAEAGKRELLQRHDDKKAELLSLQKKTAAELWLGDLDELEKRVDKVVTEEVDIFNQVEHDIKKIKSYNQINRSVIIIDHLNNQSQNQSHKPFEILKPEQIIHLQMEVKMSMNLSRCT